MEHILRGIDIISSEATLALSFVSLLSESQLLKESDLLLLNPEADSVLQEKILFWKGFILQASKQEVTKVVSLYKNGGIPMSGGFPWALENMENG